MIYIDEKDKCCGCEACVQICPKSCVTFCEDDEGFYYPEVDIETCINCHLCEKVCPMLNQRDAQYPLETYSGRINDDIILRESSSGGIFSLLAEYTIMQGGVVFGARYDECWNVVHDYTDSLEGIKAFRGSKYTQSKIGKSYILAESFLKEGRIVLFTGTSCQILGLKTFLGRGYPNLLAVDIVCHGVPSPKIWQAYLKQLNPQGLKITSVNLRDKSRGWKRYSYMIKAGDTTLYDDYAANSVYLKGFMSKTFLRPSCYGCPAKNGSAGSDITLADNWGIWDVNPNEFDDKGMSAILINSEKGKNVVKGLNATFREYPFDVFIKNNLSYTESATLPKYRKLFWLKFPQMGFGVIETINNKMRPSVLKRAVIKLKRMMNL